MCVVIEQVLMDYNRCVTVLLNWWAVSNWWTGLLEWTTGMDYWNGL